MKVVRASVLGFCFGVRRAVELATKALEENPSKNVFSLGPLIHNEDFLKILEQKGLKIVEENQIGEIPDESIVLIRAHGVAPKIIENLLQKKCQIIDATCPRVKASQKMVERYTNQNDYVVITGDINHGEMIGIAGYAGKNFKQIQNSQDAITMSFSELENLNVILMSQTTYSPVEFQKVESILKSKIKNLAVMNTICPATNERQNALIELCHQVDGVIVIGGKTSANTKRLFLTAKENCTQAVHIQTAKDIPSYFYSLESVGITAGASTPDDIINQVEENLIKFTKK